MRVGRGIAVLLHLAVGYVYALTGLLAPPWAVVVLVAVWIVLAALALRRWRRSPWWVIATPFVAAFVWFTTLWLGDVVLGWTA